VDILDSTSDSNGRNRLDQESSPYLLQHKDNPVHWYPWDEAALTAAKESNKPILLSIGYSACHWCHVMAHESFEDPATAEVMNQLFINVKVDREERPDIDKTYQLAHQLMTQNSGGWPLTAFLDPHTHLPIFAGTYFPKTANYQLPGFTDLLRRVSEAWNTQSEELAEQGKKISEVLASLQDLSPETESADYDAIVAKAREQLASQYDPNSGGFGGAPKFPNPTFTEFLFEQWSYSDKRDREALDMVMTTLTQIARGGIYDQLGGGFCRYATDKGWMIPHFEKMLYDNGALLGLFADALRVGPDQLFEDSLRDTVGWLLNRMQHTNGAFFAAEDADSEGEEGKYYVWQKQRVKKLLTEDEYLLVETLFGLDKPANFEGKWNLHRRESFRSATNRIILSDASDDPRALWLSAKSKLLAEREHRTRPGLDDKILASWNGLAIDGLARAGMALGQPDWIKEAQRAMDFVRTNMMVDGALHATCKNGVARHPAYLDDHAFCLKALITLLQAQWREEDISFAIELANATIEKFSAASGGFYFTAHDHETLIHRAMPTVDEATASGNAVLGAALTDLGHLLADLRYLDAASAVLRWAAPFAERYPEWIAACRTGYTPNRRVFAIGYGEGIKTLPAYLPRMVSADTQAQVTAYICSGMSCSAPITSLPELKAALTG